MTGRASMRWRILLTNGIALVGIAWLFAHGTEMKSAKLLPETAVVAGLPAADLGVLERNASISPTRESVSALAVAYLDRGQPGLASAVLDKAPSDVRQAPEVAHLRARTLYQRGLAREALAVAREAETVCAGGSAAIAPCPSWLAAKTARQIAFFQEIVDAGIEDPSADPGATKAAYERSASAVRLVAMR